MKKNVLRNIESIKEERELSKETQKKIAEKIISNWAICIAILILIICFTIAKNMLPKGVADYIYHTSSVIVLIYSLAVLEIAYKKDSGEWAIAGIEILLIALFSLFSPYIFFKYTDRFIYGTISLITAYYIFKIIRIYYKEKKIYLIKNSDISNIIKKESKDELAQEFEAKRKEDLKREVSKKKTPKPKTTKKAGAKSPTKKTTAKKTTNTTKKKTTSTRSSTTKKKTTSSKTTKRKRDIEGE